MVPGISPANTSSEEDESTGCTGSSPKSLPRRLFAEETRHTKCVTRFSKRSLQISMLVALGCFFVNRQVVTLGLSRSSSAGADTVKSRLHENEEGGVLLSFVIPERSDLRYPEYDNMTAAEKVASEYVVRNITDYDPLANCSVTSQVRIVQMSSQWIMQSIDTNGNNKTVGGDEFYVTYTDNNPTRKGKNTAAALVQDLENGLYTLTFKTTPMDPHPGNLTGVGTLSVRFLYSCNIGRAHRPVKDKWKAGGLTLIHHTKSNVTQPPIQNFRPTSGVDLSPFDSERVEKNKANASSSVNGERVLEKVEVNTNNRMNNSNSSNNNNNMMNIPNNNMTMMMNKLSNIFKEQRTKPHEVLEQYKAWHSIETLRTESPAQLQQRRFAMAYYSCPQQAGNRLHHFLNSLLWGIITNRTILYHYFDTPTCCYHQAVQTQVWSDPAICKAANQQADCDRTLQRASWIPAYADWSVELQWNTNLSETVTVVDYWSVHSYSRVPQWERKRYPRLNTTQTTKVDEMAQQLIDFPTLVNMDKTLSSPIKREHVLATASARERAATLFAEGTEFLYGMLFNQVFQFRFEDSENDHASMTSRKAESSSHEEIVSMPFSIAMHSRHRRMGNDGSNVKKEKVCFDRILKRHLLESNSRDTPCRVCLMSDRPTTVEKLTVWLQEQHNCTVITWNHDTAANSSGGSFKAEHGPNAGVGFFRELDLCQHFTDGFIGTGGSSSSTRLLQELVSYNRRMQQLQSYENETTIERNELPTCYV